MANLMEVLEERLGVMTFSEAEEVLGLLPLLSELSGLPKGEVELVPIVPLGIASLDSRFLMRRGAELAAWV